MILRSLRGAREGNWVTQARGAGVEGGRPGKQGQVGQGQLSWGEDDVGAGRQHRLPRGPQSSRAPSLPCATLVPSAEAVTALTQKKGHSKLITADTSVLEPRMPSLTA